MSSEQKPQPLLKHGLSPAASDALRACNIPAEQIVQTIGDAKASAGTHAADGEIDGHPYAAAVDISVHHPARLQGAAIHDLVSRLASAGFAAFYRQPGHDHWPANDEEHIHAVYAGVPMKGVLRTQVHDYLHGRNGLASHAPYAYFRPSVEQVNVIRALFLAHNQPDG